MQDSSQRSLFNLAEETATERNWQEADLQDRLIAEVVINRPIDRTFDYLIPDPLRQMISPGCRVSIPFGKGNQKIQGYCVGIKNSAEIEGKRLGKLKEILELLDADPLINEKMLQLTRWIAGKYLCSWGQVLEGVVPRGVKSQAGTREFLVFSLAPNVKQLMQGVKLTAKQQVIIQALEDAEAPLTATELTELAQCGIGPINTLRKKGIIQELRERRDQGAGINEVAAGEQIPEVPHQMNADQLRCLNSILQGIRQQQHQTYLLHGVTGSGKTEVYMQTMQEVVSYGRQAIVLVPEISLTPQTIRRFRKRFKHVAVLHSHLTDRERHWQWRQIATGKIQVVVGARSAIFAPTPHLGVIIIDEEHETTFKQDTTPRYHAREVARERARLENIPLVLGSATPTMETFRRAKEHEDILLKMPARIDDRPMPPVQIIDTRHDPLIKQGQSLGRAMMNAVNRSLEEKGQIILFFNVRGFSPVLWCQGCGEKILCPSCDTSLTWHRDKQLVLCHTCEYSAAHPEHCPKCGGKSIRHLGSGTQKLEEEVRAKFPKARIARMDSDSMKKPGSHDEVLEKFRMGEIDILLGTQMIAKGLDFPNVTFVGVVNADVLVNQPDFRAAERAFQLLAQVAGRTGRGNRGGHVYIQTSAPDEPAIQYAAGHDYLRFVEMELKNRYEFLHPPFTSLIRLIIRGPHEQGVNEYAEMLAEKFRPLLKEKVPDAIMKGPAPCPVLRLRDHYRYHLIFVAKKSEDISKFWKSVEAEIPHQEGIEFQIDVDPLNMR